jgi:hypothetical protein
MQGTRPQVGRDAIADLTATSIFARHGWAGQADIRRNWNLITPTLTLGFCTHFCGGLTPTPGR